MMETGIYLLDITVKSTVVLLAVMTAGWWTKRASAAARHAIGCVSLVAILMLPAAEIAVPAWRLLPVLPVKAEGGSVKKAQPAIAEKSVEAAAPSIGATQSQSAVAATLQATVPVNAQSDSPRSSNGSAAGMDCWKLIFPIYLAGGVVALLPILAGELLLIRAERRARPVLHGSWAGLIDEVRRTLSIRRGIVLLKSEDASAMPMTWGFWRPRILIPGSADTWSADRRRVVLLHEGAHIQRWDALTHLLCRLACCVYWFHPLAWHAAARVRMDAEQACDDVVVEARGVNESVKPSTYASELLTLAAVFRASPLHSGAAIAMARGEGNQLQTRIRAILDSARNRQALGIRRVIVCVAAVAVITASLAVLRAADMAAASDSVKTEGFSHAVHFDLGMSEFLPGDGIKISGIRGTNDVLAPGNVYQISGTYTLATREEANLAAYVTSAAANDNHHDADDPRQMVHITKGAGTFTVVLPFASKGYPHLSFYPVTGGSSFSSVYFGSGDTLYKSPSVLVLVSPTGIWFEGKQTKWEELPDLLQKVPDRERTILSFALTTDQMTVRARNEAFYRLADLSKKYGFRYLSDTGIQETKDETTTRPGLSEKLHAWVEDFFQHNFRDITARETIEWGEAAQTPEGNLSIRYKFKGTIWEKDTFIFNSVLTFTPEGKYVSYSQLQGSPQRIEPAEASRTDSISPEDFPPVVVKTMPQSGELNVPSKVTELSVTFSKDVMDGNFSWCQFSNETFPKTTGSSHRVGARTYVLPVRLEPHHHYVIGLNNPPYVSFQDPEHRPAVYYVLAFDTGD